MRELTLAEEKRLLRVSRNIAKELGIDDLIFERLVWTDGSGPALNKAAIQQLKSLIKIYESLHTLFSDRTQANGWLHKPNGRFDNKTALDVIYSDPGTQLKVVADYLVYQCT
ncbi:MbcA/ParS/Xre antitoxin family protein [Amphritea balenae]|uniref:DUF2384 domain-containing protein n=1 Tax=Amphritea balenae TaxID=452629 RepID=A0A3P1SMS3_9GAMM|nr:MbcA/ParS/Xre antitoxin family protein [Amphritea balenae]RRC98269.1 DUF2384 domain-containing protein [Amphritea balenae]GGK80517.1 hypothetical protein GCM10007941_33620 [Amphritea balenae]